MDSFDCSFLLDFIHGLLVENMDAKEREKFDNQLGHAVAETGTLDQDFIEDELAKRRARVAANRAAMSRHKE